jgi:hypothetical protein
MTAKNILAASLMASASHNKHPNRERKKNCMNENLNSRFYTETRSKNTNKILNKYGLLTIGRHTRTLHHDNDMT